MARSFSIDRYGERPRAAHDAAREGAAASAGGGDEAVKEAGGGEGTAAEGYSNPPSEPGNHLHKPSRFLREAGGDYSVATARILLWIRPLMPEAGKPVGGREFMLLTAWERSSEVLRCFFAGKKMRGKKTPVSRACTALWLVGL